MKVWFGAVDYLKGGSEFPVESTRYVVDHSETMEDVPVPVFAWYFLLCEVDAGHFDKSAPVSFDETIGALYFGKGCNDIVFFAVDPSKALSPHEFPLKFGVEAAGGEWQYK